MNVTSDPRHCGSCATPCPLGPGQPCVASKCLAQECDAGGPVKRARASSRSQRRRCSRRLRSWHRAPGVRRARRARSIPTRRIFAPDAGAESGSFAEAGVFEPPPDLAECTQETKQIYVVATDKTMYRFYPDTLTFVRIGTLGCATTAGTFSMAIDRRGTAWVEYTDGRLYAVDTTNAKCKATPFVPGQTGFANFGMGYAKNGDSANGETLYIAGAGLAALDTKTFELKFLGSLTFGRTELTGLDTALYAFSVGSGVIAGLNKTTGATQVTYRTSATDADNAFAFAQWGGDFWLFTGERSLDRDALFADHRRVDGRRPGHGNVDRRRGLVDVRADEAPELSDHQGSFFGRRSISKDHAEGSCRTSATAAFAIARGSRRLPASPAAGSAASPMAPSMMRSEVWMPSGQNWRASDWARLRCAAFDAAKAVVMGLPRSDAVAPTTMMLPHFALRIAGSTACAEAMRPTALMAKARSRSATVVSSKPFHEPEPALYTRPRDHRVCADSLSNVAAITRRACRRSPASRASPPSLRESDSDELRAARDECDVEARGAEENSGANDAPFFGPIPTTTAKGFAMRNGIYATSPGRARRGAPLRSSRGRTMRRPGRARQSRRASRSRRRRRHAGAAASKQRQRELRGDDRDRQRLRGPRREPAAEEVRERVTAREAVRQLVQPR